MKKAWEDFEKAARAKDQALDAFLNALTVNEEEKGKHVLSLSDPKVLSQLKSAAVDFNSAKRTLKLAEKKIAKRTPTQGPLFIGPSKPTVRTLWPLLDATFEEYNIPSNKGATIKRALKNLMKSSRDQFRSGQQMLNAKNGWKMMQDSYLKNQEQVQIAKKEVSRFIHLLYETDESKYRLEADKAVQRLKKAQNRSQSLLSPPPVLN